MMCVTTEQGHDIKHRQACTASAKGVHFSAFHYACVCIVQPRKYFKKMQIIITFFLNVQISHGLYQQRELRMRFLMIYFCAAISATV